MKTMQFVDDEELLANVASALPGRWLACECASASCKKTWITRSLAWRAISTLIVEERVVNPNVAQDGPSHAN